MMHAVSSYSCPRCENAALYVGHAEGVTLHGCAQCGGVWLNAANARRIAEALPKEAILLAERVAKHATQTALLAAVVRCPVCGQRMARTHVKAAGVDIDMCGPHGTWYDRHELDRIAKTLEKISWKSQAAGAAAMAGAVAVGANAPQAQQAANSIGLGDAVDLVDIGLEIGDAASSADVLDGAVDVVGAIFGAIGALFD